METVGVEPAAQELRERHFAEEFGLLLAEFGAAPMFGRIMGHLLICDPPEQSSAEIAEALGASKGSVSTSTRQLIQAGMIERVPRPGSRATYFRIRAHAWTEMMRVEIARSVVMRERAEQGLALLSHAPPARRERLESLRDFFRFLEREWPRLVARWSEEDR
jgi:DNA-binding MarR family transcriptional regulator